MAILSAPSRTTVALAVLAVQLLVVLTMRSSGSTAAGRHELEAELGAREAELTASRAEVLSLRDALHRVGAAPQPTAASADFYHSRRSRSLSKPRRTTPANSSESRRPNPALEVRAGCAARMRTAATADSPDDNGPKPIPGGDLETPGVLEAAFSARSAGKELIFLSVGDTRDHRRAGKVIHIFQVYITRGALSGESSRFLLCGRHAHPPASGLRDRVNVSNTTWSLRWRGGYSL